MFEVGIIGATEYVGVELLRLLLNHNKVKVIFDMRKHYYKCGIISKHMEKEKMKY